MPADSPASSTERPLATLEEILPWSATPAPCAHGIGARRDKLQAFGWEDENAIISLFLSSKDIVDFSIGFLQRYAAHRGRQACLLCEKTPENIHTAQALLNTAPSTRFIHIVRDPIFCIQSLVRRGFPVYVALCSWIVDNLPPCALQGHERFRTVRYEDMVDDPYGVTADIGRWLGVDATPSEIRQNHAANRYRSTARGTLQTWSVGAGSGIANANSPGGDADAKPIGSLIRGTAVRGSFASIFGLPRLTAAELCERYGYSSRLDGRRSTNPITATDYAALRHLATKWRVERRLSTLSLGNLPAYLLPIGPVT